MEIVADLHLHSKYSRAVSPQMLTSQMAKWAKLKGIDLLGTGDFTHPLWLSELKRDLEECGQGVYRINQISRLSVGQAKIKNPSFAKATAGRQNSKPKLKTDTETKFLLTSEISSIYSQGGKTRKIHNIIIAPSINIVEKINSELRKRGCNLLSDGRPIVGLSAKNIAEIVLTVDKNCLIIPAHIWTPWFSLFGANSGFDSVEECFGEYSKDIYAVETGLSSDPEMNWQIADLNNRSIVSFSDAHSGEKLGRECTIIEIPDNKILRYEDIRKAIVDRVIKYTVEFYPEEGKYHYSGHRKCGVVFSPQDSLKKGTICPVCGRGLTPGVMERVIKLGDIGNIRTEKTIDGNGVSWIKGTKNGEERIPFVKLVPLREIIAENLNIGENSQKAESLYLRLIEELGNELEILMKKDLEAVGKVGGERLTDGIKKVRIGDIFIRPGYDGEFGKVSIWGGKEKPDEERKDKEQMSLF